ncbi:MAG: alpha/beta hydrolase [Chlamydiia bacterium]|nr:alpha/beta hydrolase [Chlamydiia bacterium]
MAEPISRDMNSIWRTIEACQEGSETALSSSSFVESSLETSSQSVSGFIQNRGGLAQIVGLLMVPSQFLGPDLDACERIINNACQNERYKIERVQFQHKAGNLEGVICYPNGWNSEDKHRCVSYHNPNAITLADFFDNGAPNHTIQTILNLFRLPVILYDYRGTGLNQGDYECSSLKFRPNYETIVEDGISALTYALQNYHEVITWGSSLGGGVATVSLERHLSVNSDDAHRVRLVNHDSFTKTARVVMPGHPWIADVAGWLFGGNLDAQTSMERLSERSVKIVVLCHTKDFVIPQGARMAEFVSKLKNTGNISLIYSPEVGHANLSVDMIRQYRQQIN